MSEFSPAIQAVLENECGERPLADVGGGFSDRSDDIGGATIYGLSRVIRNREGFSPADFGINDFSGPELKKTTLITAKALWKHVWDRWKCEQIKNQDMATKYFDALANMGPFWATRCAQLACNSLGAEIGVDGQLGPRTIDALNNEDSQLWLRAMCSTMDARYLELVANSKKPGMIDQQKNYDVMWKYRAKWLPK